MNLVAITSGKGGTGKSCVTAYTGIALSERGKKTLLIEQGMSAKSLDVILAAQNNAVFDLGDVFGQRCDLEKAIIPISMANQLFLLPAGPESYVPPDQAAIATLLQSLRYNYEYILIDDPDFHVLPPNIFHKILLVTTPDTLSVRACQNKARQLYEAGGNSLRLIINNVPPQVIPIHGVKDFDDVINLIGVQLIAVIPQSPKLQYSSNNSKFLDGESITIQVFDNLAARLCGQSRPLLIR